MDINDDEKDNRIESTIHRGTSDISQLLQWPYTHRDYTQLRFNFQRAIMKMSPLNCSG